MEEVFHTLSGENALGNRVTTEKRGWHRCGTYQIGSDAKVSGGIVKVKRK